MLCRPAFQNLSIDAISEYMWITEDKGSTPAASCFKWLPAARGEAWLVQFARQVGRFRERFARADIDTAMGAHRDAQWT
jgi:hypothetical protein